MKKRNITLPIWCDFKTWVTQIQQDLPDLNIPNPLELNQWRTWVAQLINNNPKLNIPTPNKEVYKDDEAWRQWAKDFIASLK